MYVCVGTKLASSLLYVCMHVLLWLVPDTHHEASRYVYEYLAFMYVLVNVSVCAYVHMCVCVWHTFSVCLSVCMYVCM
jgi:hypothetical protein